MIELKNVSKTYRARHGQVTVLRGADLRIDRGEVVGVFGKNGAGKSTLIRLLSGAERPSSGSIQRTMSVSWPLAFTGAFQGALTGLDNLRFICRVYGISADDRIDFIEDFSELGRFLREPVRTYSSGMRARLAFAISLLIDFDCFLIDEVVSVGDSRFHKRCNAELFEKRRASAKVIVSHTYEHIAQHCQRAAVLSGGTLHHFDDVQSAHAFYEGRD